MEQIHKYKVYFMHFLLKPKFRNLNFWGGGGRPEFVLHRAVIK